MIDTDHRQRLLDALAALHVSGVLVLCFGRIIDALPDAYRPSYAALGRRFGISAETVRMAFKRLESKGAIERDGDGFIPVLSGSWSPAYLESDDESDSVDPTNPNPPLGLPASVNHLNPNPPLGLPASVDEGNPLNPNGGLGLPAPVDPTNPKGGLGLPAPANIEHAGAHARLRELSIGIKDSNSNSNTPPYPPKAVPATSRYDLPVDPASGLVATEGPDGTLTPIGRLPDPKGTPAFDHLLARADELFPMLDFGPHLMGHRREFPVAWMLRALEDKSCNSKGYRIKSFRAVLEQLRSWQAADPPGPPPIEAPAPTPAKPKALDIDDPARGHAVGLPLDSNTWTHEQRVIFNTRLQVEVEAELEARDAREVARAAAEGRPVFNPSGREMVAMLAKSMKDKSANSNGYNPR